MLAAGLFALGAVLGSFATALAHRLPRGENWVSERSRCPRCGATIRARDNVPILSWLALRGRCRDCGERIPVRYPLTELGLAVLFASTYLILEDEPAWRIALGLVLCFVLLVVTLTDLERRIIPNAVVGAGALAALAIVAAGDADELPEHLIAAGAAGGILFVIALAHPRGMGMGDAKLVGMMGLFLGRAIGPALIAGLLAGALVGLALIARHGAAARKSAVPFGPFLALGGVVGLWAGEDIVDWYTDSFFESG